MRQNESKVFSIVISKLSVPGLKSSYGRGQEKVITTLSITTITEKQVLRKWGIIMLSWERRGRVWRQVR